MTARRRARRTLAGGLGLALALTGFLNLAVLVVPIYDMQLYDRVLQSRNMDTMAVLSAACAAGLLMYALLDWLRAACFVALAEGVGRHLNGVVLQEGVRRAAAGDRQAGPELVRDLATLQNFLQSGAAAVPLDALCVPVGLLLLFMLHPSFGWLAVGGIAALVLSGLAAEWLVRPALLAAQARQVAAGQALSRSLADPELTEGLGMLPAMSRRWAARHGAALAGLDRAGCDALVVAGVARLLRLLLQAGVTVLGAVLVVGGAATLGALMGANLLTARVLAPFDQLVGTWRHWTLALAAWRRIDRALTDAASLAPAAAVPDAPPGLLVRDVELRGREGQVLLHAVNFLIPPGTLVAVTGPNGAGKTTLLRLLAGLVPPDAGAVLLDGRPTRDPHGPGVGFLPQGVALLDGTVAENIGRFRPGAPDAAVAAARQAGVHDLVGRMARGYDTVLSGNGGALSGGMRQRVGLARALLGGPRLLVLDEPDASLDGDGTEALLRALRECCAAGAVAVVTSHRPALRAAADLVVTVQNGTAAVAAPAADLPSLAIA